MNTFSQRLKKTMDEQRVTQSDLSSITGLGKSSISQYLSGKNEPKFKTMTSIAEALNVSVDWLSGAIDEPSDDGFNHTNNLPVEQAARLMGVGKQFVRVGLQKGILPFDRHTVHFCRFCHADTHFFTLSNTFIQILLFFDR